MSLSGGGALTIYNKGDSTATISNLTFSTNTVISGNPWGTLWGSQSTLTSTPNPDGVNIDYTVSENPVITIPKGEAATFTYTSSAINGPFTPYNAEMPPTKIKVTTSSGAISPNIEGKCVGTACTDPGNGKRIMGYYINWAYWHSPQFTADQLPYDKINTVAYAFSTFDNDGRISLYDLDSDSLNIPLIAQARRRYPYLNASLSFGGWSWASTPNGGNWKCKIGASPEGPALCFSQLTADPTARAAFVANAIKGMKEVGFNGIDIDWEYPVTPNDVSNYVLLLKDLRKALNTQGAADNTTYYLTIAVSAGFDKILAITKDQWTSINTAVDYVDVMTYDFHGSWDQKSQVASDFMSAMQLDPLNDPTAKENSFLSQYDITHAIQAYLNRGIPAAKIIVGIPIYGRMINIATNGTTKGLYQTITGTPQGEWDNQQSGFTGMIDYHCIVDRTTCGNGFTLPALTLVDSSQQDPLGKYSLTPWGFSANLFITYDDATSAATKAKWIKSQGLGGVMLWELTEDFPDTDERSIVNTVYQNFK